jgi:hypothetical protein
MYQTLQYKFKILTSGAEQIHQICIRINRNYRGFSIIIIITIFSQIITVADYSVELLQTNGASSLVDNNHRQVLAFLIYQNERVFLIWVWEEQKYFFF